MTRIGLMIVALVVFSGTAHAQSQDRYIYESGPNGTPPYSYTGPNVPYGGYQPPLPPVYQSPQPYYQPFNPPPPPCVAFLGQCK
jgi:hypothetical protein